MKFMNTFNLAIGVLGIASIILFGLNIWHTSVCSKAKSPHENEVYLEALNRRLLHAESQALQNTILVNKLLHLIQVRLFQFDAKEIEELSHTSKDEAIRLALILANHPAPPQPDFYFDDRYQEKEELENLIDDILASVDDDTQKNMYSYGDDIKGKSSSSSSSSSADRKIGSLTDDSERKYNKKILTDEEAKKLCIDWKNTYDVIIDVSWGKLPYHLQKEWKDHACDYHLGED